MGIQNANTAYVNRSSTYIPVYDGWVHSDIHTGALTAGGDVIGHIHPNEYYVVIKNTASNYLTSYEIIFRDGNNEVVHGVIETSPGYTLGKYEWDSYQEPYHYYNSNGSTLVAANTCKISNTTYYLFTVDTPVYYRNKAGEVQGLLTDNTILATTSSTTGSTYNQYMIFYKKKVGSTWVDLCDDGYGFVDLCLQGGTMPNNRSIR